MYERWNWIMAAVVFPQGVCGPVQVRASPESKLAVRRHPEGVAREELVVFRALLRVLPEIRGRCFQGRLLSPVCVCGQSRL